MTLAADEIAQREQFVLLDEQSAVTKATRSDHKSVVGGPCPEMHDDHGLSAVSSHVEPNATMIIMRNRTRQRDATG
jgi:hypothetical protein